MRNRLLSSLVILLTPQGMGVLSVHWAAGGAGGKLANAVPLKQTPCSIQQADLPGFSELTLLPHSAQGFKGGLRVRTSKG
jgi:hypothetical protein